MRKSVVEFAKIMEGELRENDHKGGWGDCTIEYLLSRLIEEVGELAASIRCGSPGFIVAESADVANFAMMIAHRFGFDATRETEGK